MLYIRSSGSSGYYVKKALDPCTGIACENTPDGNLINWTDPDNYSLKGELIARWYGTRLVRKEGSYPENESDGTIVVDTNTRNQYAEDALVDPDGTEESYYALFPYTTRLVFLLRKENCFRVGEIYEETEYKITIKYDDKEVTLSVEKGVKPDLAAYEVSDSTGHEFDHWDKEIVEAFSKETYTAIYKNIITWDNEGKQTTEQVSNGVVPAKAAPEKQHYLNGTWSPTPYAADKDQTYTAVFTETDPLWIQDSWDEICSSVADGSYKTKYQIHNYKDIDLGDEGLIDFEIVGFDIDEDENGKTVPITWIAKQILTTPKQWVTNDDDWNKGYGQSEIKPYVENDIMKLIEEAPDSPFKHIVPVSKAYYTDVPDESDPYDKEAVTKTEYLSIWIPSVYELNVKSFDAYSKSSIRYTDAFPNMNALAKKEITSGELGNWWTRSVLNRRYDYLGVYGLTSMNNNVVYMNTRGSYSLGVVPGFCTGYKDPNAHTYGKVSAEGEILDTWEEINKAIGDGVYSDVYSIGNYKYVNYGETYGTAVPMEIVAFDTDEMSEQDNFAAITWMSKNMLKGIYHFDTNDECKGYAESYLKTIIDDAGDSITGEDNPKAYIVSVDKTYEVREDWDSYPYVPQHTELESFVYWTPSVREVGTGDSSYDRYKEDSGCVYAERFYDDSSRIKIRNDESGRSGSWWLRSQHPYGDMAITVTERGAISEEIMRYGYYIVIGFCTGVGPTIPKSEITVNYDGKTDKLTIKHGETPDLSRYEVADSTGHEFDGWDFEITVVEGPKTYTAIYKAIISYYNGENLIGTEQVSKGSDATGPYGKVTANGEILDSWEAINFAMGDGVYKDIYKIGDYKLVDFGSEGMIPMEIVAFDKDDMTSGDKAPITWLAKNLLKTSQQMSTSDTNAGGYASSEMKIYLEDTVWNQLESTVKYYITPVNKTCRQGSESSGSTTIANNLSIWIPSARELLGDSNAHAEDSGCIYDDRFINNLSCRKAKIGGSNTNYTDYWTRTAYCFNTAYFCEVAVNGSIGGKYPNNSFGVDPGFCTAYVYPNATIKHTVRFFGPDGELLQTSYVEDGETTQFDSDVSLLTKNGLPFRGWNIGKLPVCSLRGESVSIDLTNNQLSKYAIHENLDLYAHACDNAHREGDDEDDEIPF